MARLSLTHRVQWLPITVAMACAVALALLLFTGVRLAARLQSASTALQVASGLVAEPQLMRSELTLIQRGLETRTYVGDSLRAARWRSPRFFPAGRGAGAARTAGEAQRKIGNILGTVREGLFLIGRDGRIGGAHSDSLLPLLRIASPGGKNFEDLLRPLVDERTLLAATKYLGLLQKEKGNEGRIESVNPLNPIEGSFKK